MHYLRKQMFQAINQIYFAVNQTLKVPRRMKIYLLFVRLIWKMFDMKWCFSDSASSIYQQIYQSISGSCQAVFYKLPPLFSCSIQVQKSHEYWFWFDWGRPKISEWPVVQAENWTLLDQKLFPLWRTRKDIFTFSRFKE